MRYRSILIIFIIACFAKSGFAQCDHCNKALEKDYMQSSSSTLQQLNTLRLIDKETFEEYKKKSGGGGGLTLGIPGIVSATINGSANYEEFQQKRSKLFELNAYNYTENQAREELKIVTNPVAYKAWSECIRNCYEADPRTSRVYGYITYSDSNVILINVKYKATSTSKRYVNGSIHIDNGMVLKEFGRNRNQYFEDLDFSLERADEIGLTIKRTDKNAPTVISISADGTNVMRETSAWRMPAPERHITATVKYTVVDTKDEFSRWINQTVPSPDLHEANPKFIDLYRRVYAPHLPKVAFEKDGNYIKAINRIDFPGLADNEYYRSVNPHHCITDNDGACRWNAKYNHLATQVISPDRRQAYVTFVTGSKSCTWGSEAEVYVRTTTISEQSATVGVQQNYFMVALPKKVPAHQATIIVDVNGNKFPVTPGNHDETAGIKFIRQTEDGTNNYFAYFIR